MRFIKECGEPALLEQLAEECTELAKAALKMARKERGENPTPISLFEIIRSVHEEIADVQICIDELFGTGWLDGRQIEAIKKAKRERWEGRIHERSEKGAD